MNVLYTFQCDADYVGYTTRHLYQRIEEHKSLAVGKHVKDHGVKTQVELTNMFSALKKCKEKLDCLIHKMLLIQQRRPTLNIRLDSFRAKVFT